MQKECVPYGSDVAAGMFECVDCGYRLSARSLKHLPPCPRFEEAPHPRKCWRVLTGQGDSPDDPYPGR